MYLKNTLGCNEKENGYDPLARNSIQLSTGALREQWTLVFIGSNVRSCVH
jgi:hypothetical protein